MIKTAISPRRLTSFTSGMLFTAFLVLSACVTTSDSALTRRADPVKAVENYVQLGLAYIKRNEFVRARKHLLRALEIDEDSTAAYAALALIYHEEGDSKLAETTFLKSLEIDSGFTQGRTYYGAFLFSEKRYQNSLEQFEIASKDITYEGRGQIFINIALCNLQLDDKSAAIVAYDRALKLDRFNGNALAGLTEIHIYQQNFDKAQHYYNRMVKIIRQQGLKHSASSLWMGIRIAKHYDSMDQYKNLAMLLRSMYPESGEFSQYLLLEQEGGS